MPRDRILPPAFQSTTHGGEVKPCHCMTEIDISTVELPEGHFVAITLSRPDLPAGVVFIMDHDELAPIIQILQNAAEDAVLLDAGQPPVHTIGLATSTKRH